MKPIVWLRCEFVILSEVLKQVVLKFCSTENSINDNFNKENNLNKVNNNFISVKNFFWDN